MKRAFLALLALLAFTGTAHAAIDVAVLDSLQYRGFLYFWNEANPSNGLIKDRDTAGSPCSIASTGFGLSAICIGVDHGWITRDAARQRVLTTLQTFWNGPQGPATSGVIGYKGLFYHFLDMNTATRTWNCELSTIDTALLFGGIVHVREYFATVDPMDQQIRALADSILWRADWNWTRNGTAGISMAWYPESGFGGTWTGYNEAMIMYLLAIGSPTHPVPASDWNYWASFYSWGNPGGVAVGYYVTFPPLFGHQYSHCWIDFRHIQDPYMQYRGSTYFENSRRATLAQITYARTNGRLHELNPSDPTYNLGQSDSLWGFTASDDPVQGYAAHGAPSGFDNGTLTPTAPISSLPFAPDSVWPCIRNMWNHRNTVYDGKIFPLYSTYGFTDAFNPVAHPWFGSDVLGIDQGPIVMMIENWRNDDVWRKVMGNPDVQRGLSLAGFVPLPTGVGPGPPPVAAVSFEIWPNPARRATALRYRLPRESHVRADVYDTQGRRVATLADDRQAAGDHGLLLDARGLPPGLYLCRLAVDGEAYQRKVTLLP